MGTGDIPHLHIQGPGFHPQYHKGWGVFISLLRRIYPSYLFLCFQMTSVYWWLPHLCIQNRLLIKALVFYGQYPISSLITVLGWLFIGISNLTFPKVDYFLSSETCFQLEVSSSVDCICPMVQARHLAPWMSLPIFLSLQSFSTCWLSHLVATMQLIQKLQNFFLLLFFGSTLKSPGEDWSTGRKVLYN